ncbi:MAG: TonB-dependent receptor [Pseudomonadales bacterium]
MLKKYAHVRRAWAGVVPLVVGLGSGSALAQEGPIEEIVVTGSFIRGTPEDAALPVQVTTQQDLEDVGNPTITEMIRNLNVSNGNLGETNQFNASGGQGNEGVATVNLRGLGSERTLVLINGRRHVSTSSFGVDISSVPSIAIGRMEVLKDGAAALYGSDAIAGVVNFITRDTFEGAELRVGGQKFDESDGEYQVGAIFGGSRGALSGMLAFEYERREEVQLRDFDRYTRPYEDNVQGGFSSIGNPGTLFPVVLDNDPTTPGNQTGVFPVIDPGCEAVGNQIADGRCRFQFTQFDNLVEEQDTYKVFGELNYDFSDAVSGHVEALYSFVDVPNWATSPSYPPQALFGDDRRIPFTHPGIADLIANNPGLFPADSLGVLFPLTRHSGAGGFGPDGDARRGVRETETYRLATGLNGTLFDGDLGFDVALSWSRRDRYSQTPDMYVERMALALDGLGGPNCDPVTGTPGAGGCLYHTPTSNGIDFSAITGQPNPNANPALAAANRELHPWLEADLSTDTQFELLVFDATFDGTLPIELGAGEVGYAVGIQTRNEKYELKPKAINDLTINPCPFVDPVSLTLGNTDTLDCTQSTQTSDTGLFAFLSGTTPQDTERTVYGAFFELGLPFTERLNGQFAVRFEDYGGDVGSTVDPKLALRFQATDAIALRGSVSSTFRGPPQNFLEGRGTSLQFVGATNAFKAIDTLGNPGLSNEEAIASNFGIIFDTNNFFGSLDYWRFDFTDPIQVEDFNGIVNAYSPPSATNPIGNDCAPGGAGFGSAVCNALAERITFQAGSLQRAADLTRVEVEFTNGGDITTSGVDWFAQYDFDLDFGTVSLGTQGTYTIEYDVDDFTTSDGVFLAPGGDFAGELNDNRNSLTPILDLQGNVFVQYTNGPHRATLTGRYWGEYEDESAAAALQDIGDMFTVDLNYNVSLMDDKLTVNLGLFNLFDEDPPRAQTDLNYDPYTHDPFGRKIKLGLTYRL